MPAGYGEAKSRAIGLDDQAFGGAGMNLSLDAIMGEGDMVTTFDDFNGIVLSQEFGAANGWEDLGWRLVDDDGSAPTADTIWMNDGNVANADCDSCIRIFPGTADDAGGQMKLSGTTTSTNSFPHIWLPGSSIPSGGGAAAENTDNSVWSFACRIGLQADVDNSPVTNWSGKVFIGRGALGDTSIMEHDTGAITDNGAALAGFHVGADGSIRGVSKRVSNSAMVDGTNFVELVTTGGVDSTLANGASTVGDTMWFDLAFRMYISNRSSSADNGYTKFYSRGPLNGTAPDVPGLAQFEVPGEGYQPWLEHSVALINAGPNSGSANLVPTIEVLNGSTASEDCVFYVDWWAMGRSRVGRGRGAPFS